MKSLKYQGGWIGAAITAGAALLGNRQQAKTDRSYQRQGYRDSVAGMKLGNELDLQNQQSMHNFRYNQAMGAGLTPWEFYGSGASGAGGGTTGSGATLGNAGNQSAIAAAQRDKDRQTELRRDLVSAATQLKSTEMQTEAQRDVAEINAGVQTRGQDINKEMAEKTLALSRDKLQVEAYKASAQVGLSEAQTKKTLEEVVTSSAKFQTAMKQLSMGPANLLVELTMRHHGISLSDSSWTDMPEQQRKQILEEILALSSSAYVQGKGASNLVKDVINALNNHTDDLKDQPTTQAAPELGRPEQPDYRKPMSFFNRKSKDVRRTGNKQFW